MIERYDLPKMPEGYHPRASGAAMGGTTPVKCQLCGSATYSLFGFENHYPQNEDIWVCDVCWGEYVKVHADIHGR